MTTIEVKHITKSFSRTCILKDLSFSAEAGQCIGILGENGSGKSTLFSVLIGLQKGEGAFLCDGKDLMKDTKNRRAKVGFVPQSPPLLSELSARDNLRLWYTPAVMEQELETGCLKMLGIDEYIRVPVRHMSGGMKKRLAIGCAIAHKPSVLLLDEPTAALDLLCKQKIYDYLQDFRRAGGLVVLATHDVFELQLCDVIYLLKDGRLHRYEGDRTPNDLIESLRHE